MKLHVRLLEKFMELPPYTVEGAGTSELRRTLDDIGLEVKNVEADSETGVVFTIETLANRGDHLSVLGVARELSARTLAHIKLPAVSAELSDRKASVAVRRNTDLCPRYGLLELSIPQSMEVRNDLAAFIEEPGKRHAVVDVLNYVQMEYGHPMHAFDARKIEGDIHIDCLRDAEEIEALDGKHYLVPQGALVIRDSKKTIAVAGVIGCANSMVTEETVKVYIEAAVFDPVSVRKTARAMGIATEASHAFERGVDIDGFVSALKRVVYLVGGSAGTAKDTAGAHVVGYTYSSSGPTEERSITVSLQYIRKYLNLAKLDEVEIVTRYKNLGYSVEIVAVGKDKEFILVVPSWRLHDVYSVDDVVEDIARSISLNRIKQELPALDPTAQEPHVLETISQRVRPALRGSGFVEVISKGFYSASEVAVLTQLDAGVENRHVALQNSLEASNSHMKYTNVIHMGRILASNLKRGVLAPKIFDFTRLFGMPEEALDESPRVRDVLDYDFERDVLTLASAGRWSEGQWKRPESLEEHARYFKGVIAMLVKSVGGDFSTSKSECAFLHPGMQASIKMGRNIVGFFGVIHPVLRELCGLKTPAFYAELDLPTIKKLLSGFSGCVVSEFPAIDRDVTLAVPKREQAGRIIRLMTDCGIPAMSHVVIVDDFAKKEEDFRRVTYRLTFQSHERTLKHEEVDVGMEHVLKELSDKHGLTMVVG